MSLKGFHILFVVMITLLSLFLIVWSFVLSPDVSTLIKVTGWTGVFGLVVIPIYGVYFWKKTKNILM
jgi:hypothetical protein